jgi:long-chain acyl-CoA synthetase
MYHGPLARSAISVWVNDFRPSVISGFPAFFDVITRGEGLNADQGQIRLALTAGAPLPPEVTETWRARTGTYIGDYYGLAETGPVTFNEGHSGDQGIPLPSASIKILDLDQREVGDGTLGRIAVRSTSMAVGTLTGASDSVVPLELCEGYFRTRDQGRLQDGRLRLLGRLDSVVTIGSEKISLSEIESIILRMEHVRGAAVRLEGGNRAPFLAAYVETDVQNPDTIRRFCETRLPWAKVPARIMTIQQLPRSAAGKVLFGAIE